MLMFFTYAFIGWIIEVIYQAFKHRKFINRGFLFGPFLPIYGLSALVIHTLINQWFGSFTLQSPYYLPFIFLLVVFITTLAELIGGWLLFYFFETRWWDYSHMPYNLYGFISLRFSIIWGILGTSLIAFLHFPFIVPTLDGLSNQVKQTLVYSLSIVFIIDGALTLVALSSFKSLLQEVKTRAERISSHKKLTTNTKEESGFSLKARSLVEGLKQYETVQMLRTVFETLKKERATHKKEKLSKDLETMEDVTKSISESRFYKAFPKMKIKIKKFLSNRKNHDK